MLVRNGSDLLGLISTAARNDPKAKSLTQFALGTVTNFASPGGPYVTFDEDIYETDAILPVVNGVTVFVGCRVVLMKINGAWLITGRVDNLAPNWIPLTMNAGWSSLASPWNQAAYCLVGGVVFFRGVIQKSTQIGALETIAPAGSVPAGYLPAARGLFTSMTSGASGIALRLYVDPTGFLAISSTNAPPLGTNFGLECISYPASQ